MHNTCTVGVHSSFLFHWLSQNVSIHVLSSFSGLNNLDPTEYSSNHENQYQNYDDYGLDTIPQDDPMTLTAANVSELYDHEGAEVSPIVTKKRVRTSYQIDSKRRRNNGMDYENRSRNIVPGKLGVILERCCSDNCNSRDYGCELFTDERRLEINQRFYQLGQLALQHSFFIKHVEVSEAKHEILKVRVEENQHLRTSCL